MPPHAPAAARAARRASALALAADLSPLERLYVDRLAIGVAPTLQMWNERVRPRFTWDAPHLALLQATLDRLAAGEIRKLILEIPVRHGKSECGTISWPASLLDADPALRIIVAAYNATLASKFSRRIRTLAREAGVGLSLERDAAEEWETTAGGGVRAVGVGGGVTGAGGDVVVIDDPVKSREEAESAVYREKTWDWFQSDLFTRLEPSARILLTMSRWHEDDLTGRILASEDAPSWTVLRLPALAEAGDALGRPVGAALWPARYDEAALAAIRRTIGSYAFGSLFQQDPRPREGGMFPRERAEIVDAVPASVDGRLRWWDYAATEGAGDWTVGVRMARAGGVYYVEDVVRARLASGARDALVRQTAELDGRAVAQMREQEPGASGKDAVRAFVMMLAGWPAFGYPSSGSKTTRADPFAAQWQAGNVKLVRGAWNAPFLETLGGFPTATHDDDVDAAASAFARLAAGGAGLLDFYERQARETAARGASALERVATAIASMANDALGEAVDPFAATAEPALLPPSLSSSSSSLDDDA